VYDAAIGLWCVISQGCYSIRWSDGISVVTFSIAIADYIRTMTCFDEIR
jgi:hypothetical protein